MDISLLPMPAARFPDWLQRCREAYVSDLLATGISAEMARQQAEASLDGSFRSGAPTAQNAVFELIAADGAAVGYLWVGRDHSDDPTSWWVWDIVVDADHRGNGFGKQAMRLAEEYARSQGATALGLSVFGFNHAARGLYESLGYETSSVKMRKAL